jgi:hypothetical protein
MTAIYEAMKTQQAAETRAAKRAELRSSVEERHQAAAEKLTELCAQLVMGHNVIIARTTMAHTQVLGYVSAGVTFIGADAGVTCYTQSFSDPNFDEIADHAYSITLDAAKQLGAQSLVDMLTL